MSGGPARRLRRTARIVLFDLDNRVLLFRYTAEGFDPFWIMPGGECDPGEEFGDAARRELLEETGIDADPKPIDVVKEAEYVYDGMPVRSVEHFFCHRTQSTEIDTSRHTELERQVMNEHRWFAAGELGDWHETIYPLDISRLIGRLSRQERGPAS